MKGSGELDMLQLKVSYPLSSPHENINCSSVVLVERLFPVSDILTNISLGKLKNINKIQS